MPLSSFLCCHTPYAHLQYITWVFPTGRGLSTKQKKGLCLKRVIALWTVYYYVYFITKKPTTCTECVKLYILWKKQFHNDVLMSVVPLTLAHTLLVGLASCVWACVCVETEGIRRIPAEGGKGKRCYKNTLPLGYVQWVRLEIERGLKCSHLFMCQC